MNECKNLVEHPGVGFSTCAFTGDKCRHPECYCEQFDNSTGESDGLKESEIKVKKILEAYQINHSAIKLISKVIAIEVTKQARQDALEEVHKIFCNSNYGCKHFRPQPDMGGKNCMLKTGDLRNESGIPDVKHCPLITKLKAR